MRALVLLTIFFRLSNSYAQEDTHSSLAAAVAANEPDRVIRIARDLLRQQRRQEREAASVLVPVEVEQGLCVECKNLLGLTDQVSEILTELGEAPREVEQLAVVSSYVRTIDENGNEKCDQLLDDEWTEEFSQPDLDSAVVIYSGDLDLDRLEYWKFTRGQLPGRVMIGDTFFLRGRGDDKDLFIRLDKNKENPDQPPRVTIFRLVNVSNEELYETKKEEREAKNRLPDLDSSSSSWRPWWQKQGEYDGSLHLSLSEDASLKLGPRMEMKDYLPKNITFLDFRSKHHLSENYDLNVEGEISTDRQEARFTLHGRHGEGERVWIKVRPDGDYDVGMPYSFSFSDATIRGSLIANEDGAGASITMRENDSGSTQARYFNERGTSNFELDHNRKLSPNTFMTFRVSREKGEEKVWLMFRYNLD